MTSLQSISNGMYGSVQVAEAFCCKFFLFCLRTTNSLLLVLSKTGMDVEQRTFFCFQKSEVV